MEFYWMYEGTPASYSQAKGLSNHDLPVRSGCTISTSLFYFRWVFSITSTFLAFSCKVSLPSLISCPMLSCIGFSTIASVLLLLTSFWQTLLQFQSFQWILIHSPTMALWTVSCCMWKLHHIWSIARGAMLNISFQGALWFNWYLLLRPVFY